MEDIRYAIRLLIRSGAHSATAVLALAVGIGATVAIASAAYTVLYRPLPLADPERLVVPVSTNASRGFDRASVPYADYDDWRQQRDIFEHVALYRPLQVDLAGEGTPERASGLQVTEEYFGAMGARPIDGRLLSAADHAPDSAPVVVISTALRDRRFGQGTAVVGRDVRLAGTVVSIVGVVDVRRAWPSATDVWIPLRPHQLDQDAKTRRDNMIFQGIARLRPGVSIDEGRARVAAIAGRVEAEHPESRKGWSTNLLSIRDYVVEPEVKLGLFVLMGGVGFVLLIACVNLANLLLARAADRGREMALRTALGASRRRIIRQLMVESLLLAIVGGAAGLLLARWLVQGLVAAAPPDLPMVDEIRIDTFAMIAAAGLTLATALLFGFAPAVAASGFRPAEALRAGARGTGAGGGARRMRDVLVVAEIALAITLLAGAGLMLRSLDRLMRVDPGVDVERLLVGRVALPSARYASVQRVQFYERLTAALESAPGVEAAAVGSYVPAGARGFGLGRVFLLEGQPEPPATADHPAMWNVVSPGFFRTLGMDVVRGRAFTDRDTADSPPVMIINETMARRVFGDADPIGRRLRSWRDENLLREVVGVVSDVRYSGLADEEQSLVFVPHQQNTWGSLIVVVRSAGGDPAALAGLLRQEVQRLDPEIAVARIATLASLAGESIGAQRFAGLLLAMFASAAALLAGIGIYGVMAYAVAKRRHELGIRLALGATPARLFGLVLRRGLALTIVGAAVGLAGAVAAGRLMRGLLFGVDAADPLTLVAVPLVLGAVAIAACVLPARRAARTEPLIALQAE